MSEMRQPDRIEIRPDHKGRFDEIVARFADGMVHAEMMSNKSLYVGFYWDDGTVLQWWLHSDTKLSSNLEQSMGDPPRWTAHGVDRKPWLPRYVDPDAPATDEAAGSAERPVL